MAEDFSPDLGCYGNTLVRTPHLDRLAAGGVRIEHAFATAPVCSATRSAFNTGMYPTSIGAHHHRSHRNDGYRLPEGVKLISERFREAGYVTANPGVVDRVVESPGEQRVALTPAGRVWLITTLRASLGPTFRISRL